MPVKISIIFLLVILLSSCREKVKYENMDIQINYLDSINKISFLDSIMPISYANNDIVNLKNQYLESGRQNINLHSELKHASQLNKPLLIYFTAYGCASCRRMEELVLADKEVKRFIRKEFELIPLNVDDRTKLPESHWLENPHKSPNVEGRRILKSIGSINGYSQIILSQSGSQPIFIVIDENRKLGDYGFTKNANEFMGFLEASIENYYKN